VIPERSHRPRAERYVIPIPVLYRTRGERVWFEGCTENISKSGVLVRADRSLEPDTRVEILLNIPEHISTPFSGTTICRGRIVRAEGPSALEDRPAFAAAILEYETTRVADPRRI
jgi:PilZ domain